MERSIVDRQLLGSSHPLSTAMRNVKRRSWKRETGAGNAMSNASRSKMTYFEGQSQQERASMLDRLAAS
jgi:hypothetical protein